MRAGQLALGAVLLVSLFAASSASALQAPPSLAKARRQVESSDYRISGRLVRVDASGARTSENLTLESRWFPDVLRMRLDITSPPAARLHALLEMRADGRDSIRIARPGDTVASALPLSRWADGPLGEAFGYEDFWEAQYFWPGQKNLGQAKFGARMCDRLLSMPGAADRTGYAEVESWLDPDSGFPVYVEKKLKGSDTLKQFTFFGLRQTRGVWSAHQVEAKIRGRAGSTLFIVERGTPQAHLGPQDFDPARLTRF